MLPAAEAYYELVSGRRPGLAAALLRGALAVAEVPYAAAVRWRNRRFDRGWATMHRVPVPVVSVGNLTLGGTGKTPLVEWIAREFRRHGIGVAVVSRGYGAAAGTRNDEALELARRLPDVPQLQDPDRVAAAERAIEQFHSQVILLDDAFQHRRIARDLDIVVLDAVEPFGFGRVFPRGTLREPVSGLQRADLLVLSRADMAAADRRADIRRTALAHARRAGWVECCHAPVALVNDGGDESPVAALSGQPVAAFCGLGNPAGFRHSLAACGLEPVAFRAFPDHHPYRREDLAALADWGREHSAEALVCTCKDLAKLRVDRIGDHPLWALRVALEILDGEDQLLGGLRRLPLPWQYG